MLNGLSQRLSQRLKCGKQRLPSPLKLTKNSQNLPSIMQLVNQLTGLIERSFKHTSNVFELRQKKRNMKFAKTTR